MAKSNAALAAKHEQLLSRFEKDKVERDEKNKYSSLDQYLNKTVLLSVADLVIEDNCRKTLDVESPHFFQLMESIKNDGILQNLVVEIRKEPDFKLICVSGQRRLLIAQMLKIEKVNCLIKEHINDNDSLVRGLDENILREGLNPIDLAEAYLSLQNAGWSEDKISERYDRNPRTVGYYINLAKFPEEAKKIIKSKPEKFSVRILLNNYAKKKWNSREDLLNAIKKYAFQDKENKMQIKSAKKDKIKKSLHSFYTKTPEISEDMKHHIERALKYLKLID